MLPLNTTPAYFPSKNQASSSSNNNLTSSNSIDFCYTYIIPIICLIGILTNATDIIVFSSRNLKDITFKYLRINALANLIYLLISFFLFSARCGIYCSFSKTYAAQIYMYFFYSYIKGIFALLSNCILIFIGVRHYLIVTNKSLSFFNYYRLIIAFLFVFSSLLNSPSLFTREIVKRELNQTISNITSMVHAYSTAPSVIGQTELGKWLIIAVSTIFRGYITLFTLILIDFLTIVKLRKHEKISRRIKANQDLSNIETSNKTSSSLTIADINFCSRILLKLYKNMDIKSRLTLTAVSVSLLFTIGNIPNSMLYVFQQFVDTNSISFKQATLATNIIIFATQGCNIFIYYSFNNQYGREFNKLMSKFKRVNQG